MPNGAIFRSFDEMVEIVTAVERGPMQPLVIDALNQLRPMYDGCYFPPYPWITSFTQYLLGHYDITNEEINKWYRENRTRITTDTVIPIIEPMHTFDAFHNIRLKPFLAMAITGEEFEDVESCFVVFARDMLGFCAVEPDLSTESLYLTAECKDSAGPDHLFISIPNQAWHLARYMFTMKVDYLVNEKGSDRYRRIKEVLDDPDKEHPYSVDDYILIDLGTCGSYPDEKPKNYLEVGRDDPDAIMSRVRAAVQVKSKCIVPFYWPIL